MKRVALMILLIGGMFAAAIGQTQASTTTGHTSKTNATKTHTTKKPSKKTSVKAPAKAQSLAQATATAYGGTGIALSGTIGNGSLGGTTVTVGPFGQATLPSNGGGPTTVTAANASVTNSPNGISSATLSSTVSGTGSVSTTSSSASTFSALLGAIKVNGLATGGIQLAASSVSSTATATCGANGPTVSGSSTLASLIFNGFSVTVTGSLNQIITLGSLGQVVINQQSSNTTSTTGDITVTALHITLSDGTDIVVGQSEAAVTCSGMITGTTTQGTTTQGTTTEATTTEATTTEATTTEATTTEATTTEGTTTGTTTSASVGGTTANTGQITIHKDLCTSYNPMTNTCNKQMGVNPGDFTFYICTGTQDSCISRTGTLYQTFVLHGTDFANNGGQYIGEATVTVGSFPTGDYTVCESPTDTYTSIPRPTNSTGGNQTSPSGTACINFSVSSSGNTVLNYLNVLNQTTTSTTTASTTTTTTVPTTTTTTVPTTTTTTTTGTGRLEICKVGASADVQGHSFAFTLSQASNDNVSAAILVAGTANSPGCTPPIVYNTGTTVTVTEAAATGFQVQSIIGAGTSNTTNGTASLTVGSGNTVVTFTNEVAPVTTTTTTTTSTTTPAVGGVAINKCVSPAVTPLTCSSFGNAISTTSGSQVVYIVTLANNSNTALTDITATDPLQPGQSFVTCAPGIPNQPGPSCSFAAGTATMHTGPIDPNTAISFYLTVTVGTGPLTITNQALVGSLGSQVTTVFVAGVTTPNLTPVVPVVAVNTPLPTATPIPPTATPIPPTATGTPVAATSTPLPTATSTPVPVAPSTAVPTDTATVAPTDTPVPPVPTNTPKPAKKPTATATTPPVVQPGNTGKPPATPKPVPAVQMPGTGFGGTDNSLAHNAAMGRVYRGANGHVALGINAAPRAGGAGGPLGSSGPVLPIILGAIVVGLGVLTRKFAFLQR